MTIIENYINLSFLFSLLKKEVKIGNLIITTILVTIFYEILLKVVPQNLRYFIPLTLVMPFVLIYRLNVIKTLIAVIVSNMIVGLMDIVITFALFYYLGVESVEQITNYTAFYYMGYILLYTLSICLIRIIKLVNNSMVLSNDSKELDLGIVFNYIFTLLLIFPNAFILLGYLENRPLSMNNVIISVVSMIAMFILSVLNSQKRYSLIISQQEVEFQKNYNASLKSLVDGLRTFKHDYNNTLATLYGYAQLEDIKSLKEVLKEIIEDSKVLTTLDKLNPDLIKNPSIYGLITSKYQRCEECNVTFNIEIFTELEDLEIRIFDLTRMLGIFLDNAIEAASGSRTKKVNLLIREKGNEVILEISNTFSDKAISTDIIFNKGISSKGNNRGLGLYKVKDIVKRYSTVSLETFIADEVFVQRLSVQKSIKNVASS